MNFNPLSPFILSLLELKRIKILMENESGWRECIFFECYVLKRKERVTMRG